MNNVFYEGYRRGLGEVTVIRQEKFPNGGGDSGIFSPRIGKGVAWHSNKFDWGNYTDSAAQLALCLLYDATGDAITAIKYHRELLKEVVSKLPDRWDTSADIIRAWVEFYKIMEQFPALEKEVA